MTRIAIDARRLQDDPPSGGGRWLANLLPFLSNEFDIVLLTDARRPDPAFDRIEIARLGLPASLPEPVWLHAAAGRWLRKSDKVVFHATYNAIPVGYRGPSVLTLFDLMWEHHRADMTAARWRAFRAQARRAVRTASSVVTISDFSRRAITTTYGVPIDQIVVAPPAVDPVFGPHRVEDLHSVRAYLRLDGPYVLALGGSPRRGLEVAVSAWRRLGRDRPNLVVVGKERPPDEAGLIYAGTVNDREWSALLAGALTFCYPTLYEGFGMPALEAIASGAPVVCARVGPLPEVLGDAAQWCESSTVDDIAAGLIRMISDEPHRLTLRTRGLAQADARSTWSESAELLAGAYRSAASGEAASASL